MMKSSGMFLIILNLLILSINGDRWYAANTETEEIPEKLAELVENADDDSKENGKIPIDLFEKIQNLSVDEFLNTYVKKSKQQPDDLANDFNGVEVARRASVVPPQAVCKPINTVVELIPNNRSTNEYLYFPTCTTIKRCAGCCASDVFECQPTDTQILNFEIYRTSAYTNGGFDSVKKEIVTRVQHNKCACQCRIKKEHCNKYQVYDAKNCLCNCNNYDAHKKCNQETNKIWIPSNCTCVCRKIEECTTGLYFNHNECRCTKISPPTPTPYTGTLDRRQFILKPVLIDPDSNTKYNTD